MHKHSRYRTQRTKNKKMRANIQRMRVRFPHWLQNVLMISGVLAVMGIFAFFTISSVSAQSIHPLSSAKQQLEQSQVQWHASVDKKKAPKGIVSAHSCLVDLNHSPVVESLTQAQMLTMHNAYASFASVISAEHKPYFIFGENNQFVVQAVALDPCKASTTSLTSSKQVFNDPLRQGYLTITSVHGDLVSYRATSGATGAFNYVTGQFV